MQAEGRNALCLHLTKATAEAEKIKQEKRPPFPFVAVVGQDELKLALLLNVIDPNVSACPMLLTRFPCARFCIADKYMLSILLRCSRLPG